MVGTESATSAPNRQQREIAANLQQRRVPQATSDQVAGTVVTARRAQPGGAELGFDIRFPFPGE